MGLEANITYDRFVAKAQTEKGFVLCFLFFSYITPWSWDTVCSDKSQDSCWCFIWQSSKELLVLQDIKANIAQSVRQIA